MLTILFYSYYHAKPAVNMQIVLPVPVGDSNLNDKNN